MPEIKNLPAPRAVSLKREKTLAVTNDSLASLREKVCDGVRPYLEKVRDTFSE